MKTDLEILYSDLQERMSSLKDEIIEHENSTEILHRTDLDARYNELSKVMVRVQNMLLSKLHKTFS